MVTTTSNTNSATLHINPVVFITSPKELFIVLATCLGYFIPNVFWKTTHALKCYPLPSDLSISENNLFSHIEPKIPMLTWDEIKEMNHNDITIGSHTLGHVHLTKVSLEKAKRQSIIRR
jgi:hypothetical protein